MTQKTNVPTKPSFLEAGLPCASLSAECQRDNNARQRPPQNRLHIWWARRPPTICRAAILAGLLPHDVEIPDAILPDMVKEPSDEDMVNLSTNQKEFANFFQNLIDNVKATDLTENHKAFLRTLCITGDSHRAYLRLAEASGVNNGKDIILGSVWGYRHPAAFYLTPSAELINFTNQTIRYSLNIPENSPICVLDLMAGGGAIPLESVRYGFKTFSNDLNPVSSLVVKSTIEYPTKHGFSLKNKILQYSSSIHERVKNRLHSFFPLENPETWWNELEREITIKFGAKTILKREPDFDNIPQMNTFLWLHIVPCPQCGLNIPISTNFNLVKKKGRPDEDLAAFPEVPVVSGNNDCTFRVVKREEWKHCTWPKPGFDKWNPSTTTTYKGGNAECPRCGTVISGDEVKAIARKQPGGLSSRMYAVVSKVPVKLTYKNGDIKIRYMWRFRAPSQNDLDAVDKARTELDRLLPKWEAQGLVPDEEIPEGEKTREPRNMGMTRWRHLFTPRQLLTNVVILEEILKAQQQAMKELPVDEAEAVGVYLAFILSKVVNYNSVNTFWHYGRNTVAQTFSRHDFAFRPAFCEFEGARETVMWGASQVIDAYETIAALIHGVPINPDTLNDEKDISVEYLMDEFEEENSETGSGCENVADESQELPVNHIVMPPENTIRPEVLVPTVTCEDAAALTLPEPGSVHLICVDPPYYNNVQYAELSNFFYVWLKRSLKDYPGLSHLFREPLAETNREAVANAARWQQDAQTEQEGWQKKYDEAFGLFRSQKLGMKASREKALLAAGPKPLTAKDRADRFYENKMAAIFRRGRLMLHPAGRMVVMFNHKQTWAWRSLGLALIRAGFEIRSSVPIRTEAESSLNIRGLDAARSTILLLCLPIQQISQPVGNWAAVKNRIFQTARNFAGHFQSQGLSGTDLYLSVLGPALGEVARNWPVTDITGEEVDLADALNEAYRSVAQWRLEYILSNMETSADSHTMSAGFTIQSVDRDTQTLWLWLDTFQSRAADSDDVQKLGKALNVDPESFRQMGLLDKQKDIFLLQAPHEIDLRKLSFKLKGGAVSKGRQSREADAWEQRTFDGFLGAAVWNAIHLMTGQDDGPVGPDALSRWLTGSGYGNRPEFMGAFGVTMHLLEKAFSKIGPTEPWHQATLQARRAWDLVLKTWRT